MSRDSVPRYPNNNGKQSSKQSQGVGNSLTMPDGSVEHLSKNQISPKNYAVPTQRPWRYTTINNVKVVYNIQDAKSYIQKMADNLEINQHSGSSEFIQSMLQTVQSISKPSDGPFEHIFDGAHEKCYILVLIQTKVDRIEIGYSYHSITDVASNDSASGDVVMPSANTFDWFKAKARESLRIPAGVVSHMINNKSTMTRFQNQQLSTSQEQKPIVKFIHNNQEYHSTGTPVHPHSDNLDSMMD
ncbi:unnamed protein product [Rotaria sp. Silwood1]|nr:unnamed protein product [Rotaria sp. Silwood1]CAF1626370.1 unnamed protein product [Rotaria sp. Silwood1]CAF3720999.1 unnamed protein product [Rotaria sp. Silwood1]CAF3811052.1 unnamed protein product [Rotaria sp. Silwood1]CAF3944031.1 unnamed protein product [Rotaria sp. Silwood1]